MVVHRPVPHLRFLLATAYIDNYNSSQENVSKKVPDSMDSIDEDDYELEDGFADRGEAPPLQEQVMSIVQLMNEL